MLKRGDRIQLVDHWRLPAVGNVFPEQLIPCGTAGVVAAVEPNPFDSARSPYAWVTFEDYHPPCGPGNPFQIRAHFLKKPEGPASVGLQRCSRALRDAALDVVVRHGVLTEALQVRSPAARDHSRTPRNYARPLQ